MAATPPSAFVGREAELARLAAALEEAGQGRAPAFVVEGESGAGKTRLLREFAAPGRRAGGEVALRALRRLRRRRAALLAVHRGPPAPLVPGLSRRRATAASGRAAVLRSRCSTGSSRRGAAPPSCCCSTTCTGPTGRPGTCSGSCSPTWPAGRGRWWWRRCGAKRSSPATRSGRCWPSCAGAGGPSSSPSTALGKDDVADQLTAILGETPDPELLDQIWRRSEGNPFFVEELLAAARLGAPADLRDWLQPILAARLDALSPDARAAGRGGGRRGRARPPPILAEVSGMPEPALLAGLRECVDHHVLVADGRRRHLRVPPQPAAGSGLRRAAARRSRRPPRRLRPGPHRRPGRRRARPRSPTWPRWPGTSTPPATPERGAARRAGGRRRPPRPPAAMPKPTPVRAGPGARRPAPGPGAGLDRTALGRTGGRGGAAGRGRRRGRWNSSDSPGGRCPPEDASRLRLALGRAAGRPGTASGALAPTTRPSRRLADPETAGRGRAVAAAAEARMLAGRYGESRRLAEDGAGPGPPARPARLEEAEILGTLGVDLRPARRCRRRRRRPGRGGRGGGEGRPAPAGRRAGSTGPRCSPVPSTASGGGRRGRRRPRPPPEPRPRPLLGAALAATLANTLFRSAAGRRRPGHRRRPGRGPTGAAGSSCSWPGPPGRRTGRLRRRPRRPRAGRPPLDPGRRPPLPGPAAHAGRRAGAVGRPRSATPGRPSPGPSTWWPAATTPVAGGPVLWHGLRPDGDRRGPGPGRRLTARRRRPRQRPPPTLVEQARALQRGPPRPSGRWWPPTKPSAGPRPPGPPAVGRRSRRLDWASSRPNGGPALGQPYPAAYARFREAEALLAGQARSARAATALRAAHAVAVRLGAEPFRARSRPSPAGPG